MILYTDEWREREVVIWVLYDGRVAVAVYLDIFVKKYLFLTKILKFKKIFKYLKLLDTRSIFGTQIRE